MQQYLHPLHLKWSHLQDEMHLHIFQNHLKFLKEMKDNVSHFKAIHY